MDESKWDSLMVKFIQGSISDTEHRQLLDWLEQNPTNRKRMEQTRAIWQSTSASFCETDFSPSQELDKLLGKVASQQLTSGEPTADIYTKSRVFSLGLSAMRVAAALILLVVGYFIISNALSSIHSVQYTQRQTSAHEKQRYTLPDGTLVWLNEKSQLSYPEAFESDIRQVFLSGEAFFEVAKDSRRPFVIRAGKTITQVVGTSFNLKALPEEPTVEVSVVSGKVNFSLESQPASTVALTPGMKGYCHEKSGAIYTEAYVDPNVLAWQNNRLVFRNASVKEIIRVIEKQFDVSVQVKVPEILTCRFTSTFENADLSEVLESLTIALDLRYTHTGNRYVLSGQGCF